MFGVVFGCVWPFRLFTLFQVFQVKLFTAVLGCSSCKRRFSGSSTYCLRCLRVHFLLSLVVSCVPISFALFHGLFGCVRSLKLCKLSWVVYVRYVV